MKHNYMRLCAASAIVATSAASFLTTPAMASAATPAMASAATPAMAAVPLTHQAPSAIHGDTQAGGSEFIVKFKSDSSLAHAGAEREAALADLARTAGARARDVRELGIGATLIRTEKTLAPQGEQDVIAALEHRPDVEWAQRNGRVEAFDLPAQSAPHKRAVDLAPVLGGITGDSDFAKQWDMWSAHGGVNMPMASRMSQGEGAVVAVIDTGITKHPDLDANVLPGYDFVSDANRARDNDGRDANPQDEGDWFAAGECGSGTARDSSWHGSHVAGTVAGVSNGKGIVGVAPKAKIVPVRVLAKCGGSDADVSDAMVWASGGKVSGVPDNKNKASVMNLSLGGKSECTKVYKETVDKARKNGTTIVVAAGNSHDDSTLYTPGNCQGVIDVAALTQHGGRAFYSNHGTNVAVAAPGGEKDDGKPEIAVYSSVNASKTSPAGPSYAAYSGTSMAAPHVAGIAALVKAVKPNFTPDQVGDAIKKGARPFPFKGDNSGCGAGLADANKTLALVLGKPEDPGKELLDNGGLESGTNGGWKASSSSIITGSGGYPNHSGSRHIQLLGYGKTSHESINRTINVPAGSGQARLRYWVRVASEEMTITTPRDILTVTAGDVTQKYNNLDSGEIYVQATVDVTKYRGKSFELKFDATEDSWKKTAFLIDDVSLKTD